MANAAFTLMVGTLPIAALIWCFIGFTGALKEPPRLMGLLVRLQQHRPDRVKQRAVVLDFRTSQFSGSQIANGQDRKISSLRTRAGVRLGRKG